MAETEYGKTDYSAADLWELYRKADSVDSAIFAEQRTNVRLVSGDQYNEQVTKYWERIRESEDLNKQNKLRLTKNHVQKIVGDYVNIVLAHSPGITTMPNNPEEIQDQKAAELNKSVYDFYKKTLRIREKTREQAEQYFQFGEVFEKVYFDPDAGKVIDYEPLVGPDGEMILERDKEGNPTGGVVKDPSKPIMEGSLAIETLLPFDMLRAPWAQSWEESPYFIYRKMIPHNILKQWVPAEEQSKCFGGSESSYFVFNTDSSKYEAALGKKLVTEFYFKPSKEYPEGYFYLTTDSYIILEGTLPYGLFPINYALCNKIPTHARGRSIIKTMRPYQIEINRAASAIATAQITTGDDKILLSQGSKMANGGMLPGLRAVSVAGAVDNVKIIPGRTGDQYMPYLQSQVEELYQVMNVSEMLISDKDGKLDPYAMLFHSLKNKRYFSKYAEAFSEFKIRETELLLELAKNYLDDGQLIPIIGSSEAVNIKEFRNTQSNRYIISIEVVDTDAETMLGKQLALNHTLQYAGNSLDKQDIGKIIRAMPFLNQEEALSDITLDYDNSKNLILALERGEEVYINPYDKPEYCIQRLVNRIRKSDFKFLDQRIQQNFQTAVHEYERMDMEQKQLIQRMEQGFIPTDGYLVVCDFYVTKPDGKTERVRLPYKSLAWLIQQLQTQGATQEELERQNQGALAEMAQMMGPTPTSANTSPQNMMPQGQGVY